MTTIEVRGVRVPALGFGTWLVTGQDATDGVRDALEIGYRQIDTARAYENEREVEREADESLQRLGVDELDLLLLHWPNADVPMEETLIRAARVPAGARGITCKVNADVHCELHETPRLGEQRETWGVRPRSLARNSPFERSRRPPQPPYPAAAGLPKDVRTGNPLWAPDWDA